MGDRGQIRVKETYGKRESVVYLYTHWGGSELRNDLKRALAKKWRWNDAEYLARIIFDEMVGDCHGDETGFGIGTAPHGDIEHPIIEVNVDQQKVIFFDNLGKRTTGEEYTFEEYLEYDHR